MKTGDMIDRQPVWWQVSQGGPLSRPFFIVTGTFFVSLTYVGILLPGVPQAVFLLAAVACYARASKRLEHWLVANRLFGGQLERVREQGFITGMAARIFKSRRFWCIVAAKLLILGAVLYHFFGGTGIVITLLFFVGKLTVVGGTLYLAESIWRGSLSATES